MHLKCKCVEFQSLWKIYRSSNEWETFQETTNAGGNMRMKNGTLEDLTFTHPIMQSMAICKHRFVEVAGLMLNIQHFPF